MRIGGGAWFVAGFVFCYVWTIDGLGAMFRGAVGVLGIAVKVVETVGAISVGLLLALTLAAGLAVGTCCAEVGRARKDGDDAWNRRKAYRRQ